MEPYKSEKIEFHQVHQEINLKDQVDSNRVTGRGISFVHVDRYCWIYSIIPCSISPSFHGSASEQPLVLLLDAPVHDNLQPSVLLPWLQHPD